MPPVRESVSSEIPQKPEIPQKGPPRTPRRALFAAAAGLLFAAALFADQTVLVGPGLSFVPSTVTVAPGEQVIWTWAGAAHTTTSDATVGPETWDSGVLLTGSFSHLFTTPGSYPYYCSLHSFPSGTAMNGLVQVTSRPRRRRRRHSRRRRPQPRPRLRLRRLPATRYRLSRIPDSSLLDSGSPSPEPFFSFSRASRNERVVGKRAVPTNRVPVKELRLSYIVVSADLANERGSEDNITALAARVDE